MKASLAAFLFASLLSCAAFAAPETGSRAGDTSAQPALVDLNRASLDELVALKGIGEARAAAIVKGRPYARKDELVRRGIVPESVYEGIKDNIVARQ